MITSPKRASHNRWYSDHAGRFRHWTKQIQSTDNELADPGICTVVLEAHSPWAADRKQERIKREEEQRGARLGRETEEGSREEGGAAKLLDCWFPIL